MKGFSDGLARVLVWRTDSSNRCLGQGATLANAATSGAYVIDNAIAARFNPGATESKPLRGGDKVKAHMSYSDGTHNLFDVVASDSDSALYAMLMNMTVNSTLNSVWDFYGENNNLTFNITGGCAVQQRKQRSSDGVMYWHTVIYPHCEFRGNFGGAEYRGDAPLTIHVTPALSSTAHTGQTFGSAANNWNQGLEGDQTDAYHIDSTEPIHILSVRKDGLITTFNTIFKPTSTTITAGATPNYMVINNTPTALVSMTLAGVGTFAAGVAADLAVVTYQTNYVPV